MVREILLDKSPSPPPFFQRGGGECLLSPNQSICAGLRLAPNPIYAMGVILMRMQGKAEETLPDMTRMTEYQY